MAGRPPLPIGGRGKIRYLEVTSGGQRKTRAYCQYRDLDGRTRQVSATDDTRAAAQRALLGRLAQRSGNAGDITADTRFRVAATRWLAGITAAVEAGERSPSTAAAYRLLLDRHVLPGMGDLRLREATTGRIDAFLTAIRASSGAPTAKSCRTVISGVLGYAARHDAVTTNATRNTGAISVKPRKQPRALTVDECARWIRQLAADPTAVRHDLPDLVGFMLATGVRIGEALAVSWEDIDTQFSMARIDWTIVRVTGAGLIRKAAKTSAGLRTLRLPEFATTMLRRRAVEYYALTTGSLPAQPTDPEVVLDALGSAPVFPDTRGGWRDPSNTQRDLRAARGEEFAWITSHVFRKTSATMLDQAGLTARQIADVLGHSQISMTQDRYLARALTDPQAAAALERGLAKLFPMHKPCTDLGEGMGKRA